MRTVSNFLPDRVGGRVDREAVCGNRFTAIIEQERIEALKQFVPHKPLGETPVEELILSEYQADVLLIGAPGRLLRASEVEAVLPADDEKLLEMATPWEVGFDALEVEEPEDATVDMLLESSVSVLVMCGDHDFSNNVPETCEYIRVTTKRYGEIASK